MARFKIVNVASVNTYGDVLSGAMEVVQRTKASDLSLGAPALNVNGFWSKVRKDENDRIRETQPDAKLISKLEIITRAAKGEVAIDEDHLRSLHRGLMSIATGKVAFDKDALLAYAVEVTTKLADAVLERSQKIASGTIGAMLDAFEDAVEADAASA